jgi:hypothetical protein
MDTKFKVGDKVLLKDEEESYTGTVTEVSIVNDSGRTMYWIAPSAPVTICGCWCTEEGIHLISEKDDEGLKKVETIGDVLLELEVVLDKMVDHGLQLGDIHALVHSHIWTHRQDAIEVYEEDNSRPVFRYGHKDQIGD